MMSKQCTHDDTDCQNFKAVETETFDLTKYEKIELKDARDNEEMLFVGTRKYVDCDDTKTVNAVIAGVKSICYKATTPCYRLKPQQIRADQVPNLRRFNWKSTTYIRIECDDTSCVHCVAIEGNKIRTASFCNCDIVALLPE